MRTTLLLLAALSTLSCSAVSWVGQQIMHPMGGGATTLDELRAGLLDFSSSFTVLVTEAADRISVETREPKKRRLTLLWKIRMPPLAQEAASDQNPRTGYVEALTIAVAQRQYFQDGAGASLFGAQQPIALDAAKEIEQSALALGRVVPRPREARGAARRGGGSSRSSTRSAASSCARASRSGCRTPRPAAPSTTSSAFRWRRFARSRASSRARRRSTSSTRPPRSSPRSSTSCRSGCAGRWSSSPTICRSREACSSNRWTRSTWSRRARTGSRSPRSACPRTRARRS